MSKLLVEFLHEQQEPFTLEDYLFERGYSTTSLNASSKFRNSARFLKKSAGKLCLRKRRNFVPKCSEFVRAVCSRLIVLHNINHKIKNRANGGRINNNTREIREEEHADKDKYFSSPSGTTVSDSCSESDVGEDALCSQIEVTEGECSTSVLQCKSKQPLTHYNHSVQELQLKLVGSNSYSQFVINKRALQQKKQLLIDCVREVIENHRKRDNKRKQRQLKKILSAEELWKLVCENVWLWSKDSIDETNIVNLLRCDFMASLEEWSEHCEQHKEDVSIEIGDAILEGIIGEIITSL